MKWMVSREGETLIRRKPVYTTDEVRGERILQGYEEEAFKGIVRNVKLDSQAVVAGLVPTDGLVVFTDYLPEVGDEIVVRGESYKVDRIERSRLNKLILKRKR